MSINSLEAVSKPSIFWAFATSAVLWGGILEIFAALA